LHQQSSHLFENDKQLLDSTIIFTLVHESAGMLEIATFVSTKDIGAATLLPLFGTSASSGRGPTL
jgi:hypothetical protein